MKILMVCPEYPPIVGGVGRYTYNLIEFLKKKGVEIKVISANNFDKNARTKFSNHHIKKILEIAKNYKPDILHVQYEGGMYSMLGLLGLINLYYKCEVPIVTTLHSFPVLHSVLRIKSNYFPLNVPARILKKIIERVALGIIMKKTSIINLSKYSRLLVKKGVVIFIGSQKLLNLNKIEAKSILKLPVNKKYLFLFGLTFDNKKYFADIINKIKFPEDWTLLVNFSTKHIHSLKQKITNKSAINLNKDYLTEEELSICLIASDAVLLPYRFSFGSGVMFDAIAHERPFIATDLPFFKEFAELGIGIVCKPKIEEFEKSIYTLEKSYDIYLKNLREFKEKIRWNEIANEHIKVYEKSVGKF